LEDAPPAAAEEIREIREGKVRELRRTGRCCGLASVTILPAGKDDEDDEDCCGRSSDETVVSLVWNESGDDEDGRSVWMIRLKSESLR